MHCSIKIAPWLLEMSGCWYFILGSLWNLINVNQSYSKRIGNNLPLLIRFDWFCTYDTFGKLPYHHRLGILVCILWPMTCELVSNCHAKFNKLMFKSVAIFSGTVTVNYHATNKNIFFAFNIPSRVKRYLANVLVSNHISQVFLKHLIITKKSGHIGFKFRNTLIVNICTRT